MNIHEYQAKKLFADYAVPVSTGLVANSVDEALQHANTLGGTQWMVKAQVHAGGRGKAGGVKKLASLEAVKEAAGALLGQCLVTHQTDALGQPIHHVLIESPTAFKRELYLSMVVDRSSQKVAVIASQAGGMDIEAVAAKTPEQVFTQLIHPVTGIQSWQAQELGFALALDKSQRRQFNQLLNNLYRLFTSCDCSLLEINPLVITEDDKLLALDAKINLDESALYRQSQLAQLRDDSQTDEKENIAHQFDLNYIALDGDIACMVNGAGLAMATMDLIKLHGGEPANFLDVGGGTTAERVTEAFKIILSDSKVKAILVNIFGGIVRCDLIAEGIIQAAQQTGIQLPVVVRLEGTNVEQGKALLKNSGLDLITADNLADAAQKAITAARESAV
ncbi:ADP-forming succinate--CoA ligase subunit beta [Candidatus Venteria ishoeyi]|uniref:Succinate--CoA ligase [ADP-forming] subunit beta n=1 Tax=Candidatus Venteria ishoeyi TaxID=1899563 RepID=A0A1H6FFX4_9GAMM|nr:ADP-forming succinate--CoA ligase subunit beta [Candidatus Venteria ishoeyi]SEH08937.1 Succinyl-CoA ligase [ADP-forming] subunit beta [Candidatus Venteria ishoeyi]